MATATCNLQPATCNLPPATSLCYLSNLKAGVAATLNPRSSSLARSALPPLAFVILLLLTTIATSPFTPQMFFFGLFQNMAVLVSRGAGNGQWKRCALGAVLCGMASQFICWVMWKANPDVFQVSGNLTSPHLNPNPSSQPQAFILTPLPTPFPFLPPTLAVLDRPRRHSCLCVGQYANNGRNKGQEARSETG